MQHKCPENKLLLVFKKLSRLSQASKKSQKKPAEPSTFVGLHNYHRIK